MHRAERSSPWPRFQEALNQNGYRQLFTTGTPGLALPCLTPNSIPCPLATLNFNSDIGSPSLVYNGKHFALRLGSEFGLSWWNLPCLYPGFCKGTITARYPWRITACPGLEAYIPVLLWTGALPPACPASHGVSLYQGITLWKLCDYFKKSTLGRGSTYNSLFNGITVYSAKAYWKAKLNFWEMTQKNIFKEIMQNLPKSD